MIPQILIDKAETPDGGKELRLYQHDKDFSIRVGNVQLMSSRTHESEEMLAKLALERIETQDPMHVLIGGLGMGFTLRAALDALPAAARVEVAEIMPSVVKWNRGPLAVLADHPLDDKRVEVREVNAARMVREAKGRYHAILLDVDNGPAGLSRTGNHWFYGLSGLHAMFSALRPDGVLALWSAGHDIEFTQRMEKVGFQVEAIRVRARAGKKGAHHVIWIATKKSSPAPGFRS
jgi:spermidine synthase